ARPLCARPVPESRRRRPPPRRPTHLTDASALPPPPRSPRVPPPARPGGRGRIRPWPASPSPAGWPASPWRRTARRRPGRCRRRRPSPGRAGAAGVPTARPAAPWTGRSRRSRWRPAGTPATGRSRWSGGTPAARARCAAGRAGPWAGPGAARRPGRCPPGCTRSRFLPPDGGRDRLVSGLQRCGDTRGVRAAALGDVGLAATAAADVRSRRLDQLARRDAALDRRRVERRDQRDLPAGLGDEQDDGGTVGAQAAAHVEGEGAQVAAGQAVRRRGDDLHAADVGGLLRQRAGGGDALLGAQLGELLVDVAQPGEHAADPLDQAVGRRLEQLAEPADQVALAGEVAEAVEADDRLDAARAGTDRRLAGEREGTDLRAAAHVRATAELARPGAADLDHADLLSVGLAEQRERAE